MNLTFKNSMYSYTQCYLECVTAKTEPYQNGRILSRTVMSIRMMQLCNRQWTLGPM